MWLMNRLLQSEIKRKSTDCWAAHCRSFREAAGISVPMTCRAATSLSWLIPLRAISESTALVRGTKLAGCCSAASIGTNSGASSPTKRSPAKTLSFSYFFMAAMRLAPVKSRLTYDDWLQWSPTS
jgi:hypothetical protein